ncbi:MAG TPA: histidine kinase [Bacteroidales bacterium]|nr:histidine kinase [Bacteroidales bacterium]
MRRFFIYFFLNPLFQALVVTLLIIIFVPLGIQKFKATLVEYQKVDDRAEYYYADLDHDGWSERIITGQNVAGGSYIVIRTRKGDMDQWNIRGVFLPWGKRFIIGDSDHNGRDEIFLFSRSKDSILLHVMEFTERPAFNIRNRCIATTMVAKNQVDPDANVIGGKVTDLNSDGFGELVFAINSGFSLQPRNVFAYYINNDSLRVSPRSGNFISDIHFIDPDQDDKEEIIIDSYASDNIHDSVIPYPDQSCWLMVLDSDLNFLFSPMEFPGKIASLESVVIRNASGQYALISGYNFAGNSEIDDQLFLSTLDGRVIRRRIFKNSDTLDRLSLIPCQPALHSHTFALIQSLGIVSIDTALKLHQVSKYPIHAHQLQSIDIDQNGRTEYLIPHSSFDQYFLFREDFTHPVSLPVPRPAYDLICSVKLAGKGPGQLSIQSNDKLFLFDYGLNPVYNWKPAIYTGIYITILGFVLLIRLLQHIQLKKRYEIEKQLTAFHLSSIKSQMDPHFLYNVINMIGSSIYKENRDEAYKSIMNFSKMVRTLVASSDQLSRPLSEELEFTKSYLELQKSRFRDKFNYLIDLAPDVYMESEIPKMIIQTHAENALKHGLVPKGSPGLLRISISAENEYLIIRVEDDGIGRKQTKLVKSTSTGKGLKIMEQLFAMYNRYNRPPLLQEITDLYDDHQQPAGTRVVISVPLNYNRNVMTGKGSTS